MVGSITISIHLKLLGFGVPGINPSVLKADALSYLSKIKSHRARNSTAGIPSEKADFSWEVNGSDPNMATLLGPRD